MGTTLTLLETQGYYLCAIATISFLFNFFWNCMSNRNPKTNQTPNIKKYIDFHEQ
jgi:hypothetical protein